MSNRRALLFKEEGGFTSLGLILQVKTDNTGTSDDDQFTIPRFGFANYDVETSDGQSFSGQTSDLTITFPSAGTYDIAITGTFPSIYFNNTGDKDKLVDIKQFGNIAWKEFLRSFQGCTSLTNLTFTDAPDLSALDLNKRLADMFKGCTNMTSLTTSTWDTSTVLDFGGMFENCTSLDVSFADWDISSALGFTDFLTNGELSTANYDATLIAWEAQAPPTGLTADFGTSIYTEGGTGGTARASLISTYSWTINDGGATFDLADLISEWKMNGNSNDSVGTNNGTDTSMSYVSGLVGDCADFTAGVTSDINVGNGADLSFGNGTTDVPFSISFALNISSANVVVLIDNADGSNTSREYRVYYDNGTSRLYFQLFDNTVTNRIAKFWTFTPSLSTWYHITLTYDGSGSNTGMNYYAGGNKITGSNNNSGTYVAMDNLGQDKVFGKSVTNTTQSLNGYMDCVAFWDVELTADQVENLARKELAGIDINP